MHCGGGRQTRRWRSVPGGQRAREPPTYLENVEAADQLAVHNDLGERRPVVDPLQRLPHIFVREDIVVVKLHALVPQQRHRLLAEATPRHAGVALHKQHHLGPVHQLAAPALRVLRRLAVHVQARRQLVQPRVVRRRHRRRRAARRRIGSRRGLWRRIRVRQAVRATHAAVARVQRERLGDRRHIAPARLGKQRVPPQEHHRRHGLHVEGLGHVRLLLGLDVHE